MIKKNYLCTRKEASKFLGIDPRTFDVHFRPYLKEIKIGNRVLFRFKDIQELIDSMFQGKYLKVKKILQEIGV